jgi:EmrB/QacA subfamily drug resistance transporter
MAPAQHRTSVVAVLGALFLALLLAALDQTIVSTALPTIVGELGGLTHLSWVVTAYLLTSTVAGPFYGKLGDIYGRKIILQSAIVIFLVGSALCGLAQNMIGLIAFRALQGIGGGGLIVTIIAVIGDLIPPRERGRYQGLFGAAFGLATILGPLLGGFFVDQLTWRWIFYINLPTGLLALFVIAVALPPPSTRRRHEIDYRGGALLTIALTATIVFTSLGGISFAWTSPVTLTLIAVSVISAAFFVAVERHAREPLLPMTLFRNRNFVVASSVGLILGLALFGSVTFLPIYLQVAKGVSPSASGLMLMPMMFGMLITSILSGRIISRWGRYKLFPVTGTAIMTFGLFMLSRLSLDSHQWQTSLDALWLGLGMGMVMQVLILAVQNSIEYEYLGVATSGTMLFRSVGGALGVALFGAIFAGGLRARLGPEGLDFLTNAVPAAVRGLPPVMQQEYIDAVMAALRPVFVAATCIAALGFVLTIFLQEIELRDTAPAEGLAESFAMPRDATSLEELERIITVLIARENRWRVYADFARQGGIDLPPPELWMLARLGERERVTLLSLSRELKVPETALAQPLNALCARGLAEQRPSSEFILTDAGAAMRERMLAARRRNLADLLARWQPEQHPDVLTLIDRLARALSTDLPAPRQRETGNRNFTKLYLRDTSEQKPAPNLLAWAHLASTA